MLKLFYSKTLSVYKLLITLFLVVTMFMSIDYSSLFAVILSSEDISSKYEIVGVISNNVVVLKDKSTGNSLTRREGELLSQELKIAKINLDSVILTDSSGLGQRFVLEFDKFGSSAKAREETARSKTPAPATTTPSSNTNSSDIAKSSSGNDSSKDNSASELSQETLDLLDKFYENPDSFSSEQIKDLERRLIDGL